MQNRVGIIGVGSEGFRPVVSDLSTREMMYEAAARAYADAAIDPRRDVGSFICCTEDFWEGWSIADEMVPDQIGGAGRPVCTIPGDALTGLGNAVMQILSGVAEVVTLEAHSKAADVIDKEAVERMAQEPSMVRPVGAGGDALAALEMDAFMREGRHPRAKLDDLLVRMKTQAIRNPRASYGAELTKRDLEGSEVLSSPLRRIDKAPYADAGVVLILASQRWIRKNRRQAVYVDGVAWESSLPWYDGGDVRTARYASGSYARARLPGRTGKGPR